MPNSFDADSPITKIDPGVIDVPCSYLLRLNIRMKAKRLKYGIVLSVLIARQLKPNVSLCIYAKRVTSLMGLSTHHCACGQHSSFQRNAVAVAIRWQHCVRVDLPEI